MGRVTTQTTEAAPPAPTPPSTPITHFTHPHDLHPIPLFTPQALCSGCKHQSSGTMFACLPCNFILHQSCAKLPQLITHPSHGGCTLTLLTTASYPGGVFSCDACARTGDAWSYHCTRCEYDLHVTCASKPLKIKHPAHVTCELDLTFKNPYVNSNGFSCDICRKIGAKQWLYRCNTCEYDVHLDCTTSMPRQVVLQHHHSFAAGQQVNANLGHQPHLMHSASTGSINVNPGHQQFHQQGLNPMNPGQVYGSPVPMNNNQRINNNNNQGGSRVSRLGGNLAMSAMQGLVEGAFQGIGQTVVQEVFAGGDGGGGGGDYGGGGGGGDCVDTSY